MDQVFFHLFNQFVGRSELLDDALRFSQLSHVKSVPFLLVVWALWFLPNNASDRTKMRERLCAVLICALPVIAVTRAAANYLPFSLRPIHTPDLEVKLLSEDFAAVLDGWSSMPSDHASLFIGIAVAILMINRIAGLFLLAWAVFIVSLPRIVMGLHWPSDILVGALIGAMISLLLLWPFTWLVRKTGLVKFFEAREALGYPLLFLFTYEVARMFELSRYLLNAVLS